MIKGNSNASERRKEREKVIEELSDGVEVVRPSDGDTAQH